MIHELLLANDKSYALARSLASMLKIPFELVEQRSFPDGETYVRVPGEIVDRNIVLVWAVKGDINNDLVSLLFTLDTLWDTGAKRVISVVPYMPYARQDSRFKSGEALSIVTLSKLIKSIHKDYLVTIDMHLHRIGDPSKLFGEKLINLSGVDAIAEYLKRKSSISNEDTIIVGPDEESEQWASRLGRLIGLEWVVLEKERYSAEQVEVKLRESIPEKTRKAIIIDDIISTGGTIESTVNILRKTGIKEIYVYCVHPVLSSTSLQKLVSLGLMEYACTNTLPSPISTIDVSRIIHDGLKQIV